MIKMNWHLLLLVLLVQSFSPGHAADDYREEDASEEMEYGTIMRIIPAPRTGNGSSGKSTKSENVAIVGKSAKMNFSQAGSTKSAKSSKASASINDTSAKSPKSASVKSSKTAIIKSSKFDSVKSSKTDSVKGSRTDSVKGSRTYSVQSSKNSSLKSAKSTSVKGSKSASISKKSSSVKGSKKASVKGLRSASGKSAKSSAKANSPTSGADGFENSGYALNDPNTGGKKNAKSSQSVQTSSGKSKTGNDASGGDGKVNSGSGTGTSSTEGNSIQDTMVSTLTIPKFMLTMTNAGAARFLKTKYNRNLGTYLDFSIVKIVRAYLSNEGGKFEKAVGASIQMLSLDIASESIIVKNEDTKTFISTFEGTASFTGEKDVKVNDIESALRAAFEENKKDFLKETKNSDNPNVASITDVKFSFVSEDEFTNSGGNGYSTDLDGTDTDSIKSKTLKAKSTIPMIAGMVAAISVMIAAFIYTRRKRDTRGGYKLSDEYDTDLESVPTVPKLMLSDLAAGSVQNSTGYASLITGVWASKKCSMSELAAGATQEDFAKHGLQVDVYGKSSGNKKEKSKKKLSPNPKVKGTMLVTNLDPIEEVRSATGSESWQEGDEQITNAPPLLPSLSVSNSSGSEADELDASFRSPHVADMTEYAEMSSIDGSLVFNGSTDSTPMRHLNFSSRSYTDDDSVLDATNPCQSDKSLDGCPTEKCLAEEKDIEVVPLGFEESAEEEEGATDATLPVEKNNFVTPDVELVSDSDSAVGELVTLDEADSVSDDELLQAYVSGKEVKQAVFGSDSLEVTQMVSDSNSVSMLVSDDESMASMKEDNVRSSMSVDGNLTDISLSGCN